MFLARVLLPLKRSFNQIKSSGLLSFQQETNSNETRVMRDTFLSMILRLVFKDIPI